MPHRLRRSQLIELEHAAAGHEGMRSDRSGYIVVKPCHQAEIDFYETLSAHPDFRFYTPEFIGTLVLNQEASTAGGVTQISRPGQSHSRSQSILLEPPPEGPSATLSSAAAWTPSGGGSIAAERGVALENVTSGVMKPNILDVKLGARLWADDAPEAKRERLDKVAAETTSGSLSFRIAGMKTWQGPNAGLRYRDAGGYRKCGKDYGRDFNAETVKQGFREYFLPEDAGIELRYTKKILRRFIADLNDLTNILEREESRMYSASLLFVYEGDGAQLAEKFKIERVIRSKGHAPDPVFVESEATAVTPVVRVLQPAEATENEVEDVEIKGPRIQELKVIDFAHAAWTPGQGPDENILKGIRNVTRLLQEILDTL